MTAQLRVDVFANGTDSGYLGQDQRWWFNPAFPHAFAIFDLDGFYGDPYFSTDHVGSEVVARYVAAVTEWGRKAYGRPIESIGEFGTAAGWFTRAFLDRGLDIVGVEGSHAGHARSIARGVPAERMHRLDLRRRIDLGRRFDIALCTEVAEHIEPPFSSQLVENLVRHAPLVWFSFEEPTTNEAHYHHCNEQPTPFWRNLFGFYGYGFLPLPAELSDALEGRGRFLAYDRSNPAFAHLAELEGVKSGEESEVVQSLGHAATEVHSSAPLARRLAHRVLPARVRAVIRAALGQG